MFLKTLTWCQIFCTSKMWSCILTNFGSSSIEKCLLKNAYDQNYHSGVVV